MSMVFGEVAGLYDQTRPGYLPGIADVVLEYAGDPPAGAAEIGAGTGKATSLFAGRGFPITCVEPDNRMSELLAARFPDVTVATVTFEDWTPPDGGVDLLYAALAWHWLDPGTRVPLAARALAPGGTLALIDRTSRHLDPELGNRIREAFHRFGPASGDRAPLPELALPELGANRSLTDPTTWQGEREVTQPTGLFLRQLQTLSPFRRRTPENQQNLLAELERTIDAHGGTVGTRTVTSLVLARKVA